MPRWRSVHRLVRTLGFVAGRPVRPEGHKVPRAGVRSLACRANAGHHHAMRHRVPDSSPTPVPHVIKQAVLSNLTTNRNKVRVTLVFATPFMLALTALAAPAWDAPPPQQEVGHFWRYHWYQRGLTNGNPAYEARFRVNAPEAAKP